ncbi:sulfotransferase [Hoeflea sp. TYP-13]|uniref:sulfotransferase n=1 Tax=Hoeflea sp. TYP-13 TaxID=3230023 RepID=UPI0034C61F90
MRKPNLFIVGAPKCGTTALATWLSEHPEIFVCPTKEPHYFSSEFRLTPSLRAYEQLFVDAGPSSKWLCEASVWHMYSPFAVQNILEYNPYAKFIAMVRNPVEMVPSMHRHQCYNSDELVSDLNAALDLNDERLNGHTTGVGSGYPADHLAYFHSCALGWQLRRLVETVPQNQLHVILFDDLKQNPALVYRSVLSYLGAAEFDPDRFDRINAAKDRRFQLLDRAARNIGNWKSRRDIKIRFGILSSIRRWNRKVAQVQALPDATRKRLADGFEDDVNLMQSLLRRDLSHWMN